MATQLLISEGLSALRYYLPGDPRDLNLLFIPTAADFDGEPYWLDRDRAVLERMGFQIRNLDIKGLTPELSSHLVSLVDVVFVAGGNTFHLLHHMNESGFGAAIKDRPELFYVGASAGAAIAGPDIEPISPFDRPELADRLQSTAGLGLVPIVPLPHYDKYTMHDHVESIVEHYADRFEVVPFSDTQAIAVVDGKWELVKSSR